MTDLTIRPTAKFIMVRTVIAAIVFLAAEIIWYTQWRDDDTLHFLPLIAPLIFISPALASAAPPIYYPYRFRRPADATRRERFPSRSRTIQLSNVQDVRVHQSLMAAYLASRQYFHRNRGRVERPDADSDIDNPQAVADQLLDRAHSRSALYDTEN